MNVRALASGWLVLAAGIALAQPAGEVHGSGDVFAAPGVALAWGVLRGRDEAATTVVIRVATERDAYPWVAVAGIDPFTRAEQALAPAAVAETSLDVRIPRARFAELPRTEIRLYATPSAAQMNQPKLTVFYLGIPDTTPEFADAGDLDAYLSKRIAGARSGGKTR